MSTPKTDKNPASTCQGCAEPDTDDMVQCDACDTWWHFACVGVKDSIEDKDFICPTCVAKYPPQDPPKDPPAPPVSLPEVIDKTRKANPAASDGGGSSTSSKRTRTQLHLKKLEAQKALLEKQLDLERRENERKLEQAKLQKEEEIERKRLELEEKFINEQFRLLEENIEEETDDEEVSEAQSSVSKVLSWQKLIDQANKDRSAGRVPAVTTSSSAPRTQPAVGSSGSSDSQSRTNANAVAANAAIPLRSGTNERVTTTSNVSAPPFRIIPGPPGTGIWYQEERPPPIGPPLNHTIVTSAHSRPIASSTLQGPIPNTHPNISRDWSSWPNRSTGQAAYTDTVRNTSGNISRWIPSATEAQPAPEQSTEGQPAPQQLATGQPSPQQLAARQVMPKELPTFSGCPEEWPLFISSFNTSTQACGYTASENLVRLQRCLKGPALDAVRSRLLFPNAVPQVIATLRMLYGRPEILIFTLLQKLREVPAPKPEKLDTLIGYGMAVQNLCDQLEIDGQEAHLNNPTLLYELVDKLPANLKLDWAMYKSHRQEQNLRSFAQFMATLVEAASEVTLHIDLKPQSFRGGERSSKNKEKSFCGAHSSSSTAQVSEVTNVSRAEKNSTSFACLACQSPQHKVKDCGIFSKMSVDDRWKVVSSNGLCRICLGAHGRRPCKSKKLCDVDGCKMRHNMLLHSKRTTETPAKPTGSEAVTNHHQVGRTTLFRIIPVTLHANNRSIEVFAFLDDGSSTTLVEEGVVEQLGVEGEPMPLCLQWTANVKRTEADSRMVSVEISGEESAKRFKLTNARTVGDLDLPRQTLRYTELATKHPHLAGLPMRNYEEATPRILIGNDNSHLAAVLKIREGYPQEPIAAKTRLGWTIYGANQDGSERKAYSFHICECASDQSLHDLVREHYAIENLGVAVTEGPESVEIQRANRLLRDTTERIGQRFQTGLLWKSDTIELPDSYGMAVRRLQCLEQRMQKDPAIDASVRKQINEYVQKGYIHEASDQELARADARRTWYLPLGVALNPKKPNKIRIFCDAAAKVEGISLNSMLLKGPDLLCSLPTVLFGFRERRIALCADIQEMFHRIYIREEDRDAQRFLWRESSEHAPVVFKMDVATFGSSCSPSSAQYVKNLNAAEHAEEFSKAADAIINRHYVDDYLDSVDTEEEAVKLASEVKYVHARGGFHLRNWLSNSEEVLRRVGEVDPAAVKSFEVDKNTATERILGMLWRPQEDVFTYRRTTEEIVTHPTKRQVLRSVMSLYDPLGLLSFFVIHGKILTQDIWRSKTGWDERISDTLNEQWLLWTKRFEELDQISVPRCYFPGCHTDEISTIQLHILVDASEKAYAAVAYLRAEIAGTVRCALVTAKSKVAPLKALSIPRLELQAALLGVRLQETVLQSHKLPIQKCTFWSDSKTVLAWIASDHRNYRQFVACRVGEILSKSSAEQWRWVPTKENVADEATKWGKGPDFSPDCRWFCGPNFLYLPEDEWPTAAETNLDTSEELRASLVHMISTPVTSMVDWLRFSQWTRLWRTVAYVLRYVALRNSGNRDVVLKEPLTQEELARAENLIWYWVQREAYPDEMKQLSVEQATNGKQHRVDKDSKLRKLSPFLDENKVIRADSRLAMASFVAFDTKFPIVLPRDHHVTRLLIGWYHKRYLHANNETVVNDIRQRFHISNLRTVVRQVAKACTMCQVKTATPIPPRMAPLPDARLQPFVRSFSYVGLDLFGPLAVRVGRCDVKRWVGLFTCLTIRAVHLEVLHGLSTESSKLAIRRFVARRGSPLEIYTDNGTNFVGASNDLRKENSNVEDGVVEAFTNTNTRWIFNPPSAPHMGGAWERLVRSIKTALFTMYTTKTPSEEVFATILVEAESIVNSRPLTFIPVETPQQEALTPNHFLLLSSNGVTQPPRQLADSSEAYRGNYNLSRVMVDRFWQRWVREYLPAIARRTKWFDEAKPLEDGDLVVVIDSNLRNGWTRGRVVQVVPGRDGRSRQAVVQTSTGLFRRPVTKLAKLDLQDCKLAGDVQASVTGRGDVTVGVDDKPNHP